ncbi:recombinase family protein [Streptomyces xanthochromogenes]|uniref:Integrase n=1 Tax=Streptomyces xanthochromogenes TaxID=67384 RepID=A0ABQ2ZXM6_9ACTN|nr:integrase [Streptomyces xanthochromogenes]
MDNAYAPVGTAFTETLRGVRCVRLSVRTDETTSPERQREADDIAAAALGIDFGEGAALREAVDLDVSASKVGPFERPQLGEWLKRPDTFDALVWWRFDRAIRSMGDMHELAKWAKEHRKMLVFAEGIGGGRLVFDFRNPMDPMSELMMLMLAFAAQVESQSISDRVTGAQAAMRKMSLRWRGGGQPPYGYVPAPMPKEHGGVGWTLVPDADAVKIIERIIAELLEGKTLHAIARGLNADKVLSPAAHWVAYKARVKNVPVPERKPTQWRAKTLRNMLTSAALMGWKVHQGKPVRDDQGAPVMTTTAPIMTREEFDQVHALVAPKPRSEGAPQREDSGALLLRVIHCADCGSRMYLNKASAGNGRDVYGCASRRHGTLCNAPATIRADWADEHATAEFLRLAGQVQVTRTIEIPGYDPQPEIDATLAEFEEHQKQKGRQKSKTAQAAWQRHADALDSRLAELEAREKTEPRRDVISTGRTYADEWHAADVFGKRTMLVEAGARLEIKRGTKGGWRTLDLRRVKFTITGDLDPAIEEHATVADELAAENQPAHTPTAGAKAHRNITAQTLATAA